MKEHSGRAISDPAPDYLIAISHARHIEDRVGLQVPLHIASVKVHEKGVVIRIASLGSRRPIEVRTLVDKRIPARQGRVLLTIIYKALQLS
jgi:hypothetical protein